MYISTGRRILKAYLVADADDGVDVGEVHKAL